MWYILRTTSNTTYLMCDHEPYAFTHRTHKGSRTQVINRKRFEGYWRQSTVVASHEDYRYLKQIWEYL